MIRDCLLSQGVILYYRWSLEFRFIRRSFPLLIILWLEDSNGPCHNQSVMTGDRTGGSLLSMVTRNDSLLPMKIRTDSSLSMLARKFFTIWSTKKDALLSVITRKDSLLSMITRTYPLIPIRSRNDSSLTMIIRKILYYRRSEDILL